MSEDIESVLESAMGIMAEELEVAMSKVGSMIKERGANQPQALLVGATIAVASSMLTQCLDYMASHQRIRLVAEVARNLFPEEKRTLANQLLGADIAGDGAPDDRSDV